MSERDEQGWSREAQDELEAEEPDDPGAVDEAAWWTDEARAARKGDPGIVSSLWDDVSSGFAAHTASGKLRARLDTELYRIGANPLPAGPAGRTTVASIRAEIHVSAHGHEVRLSAEDPAWALSWEGAADEAEQRLAALPDDAGPVALWRVLIPGSPQIDLLAELERLDLLGTEAFSAVTDAHVALHGWKHHGEQRHEHPEAASAPDLVQLAWSAGGGEPTRWWGRLPTALALLAKAHDLGGVAALDGALPPGSSELPARGA
jgi:hypothetical protein